MKSLFALVLMLSIISCNREKIDLAKAKTVIENLVSTTDKGDYKNISQYYTDGLNEGEPEAVRTEKLEKLKQMLGGVETITFVSSNDTTYNDLPALFLVYKIKHHKATSIQQFIMIKEKGEYKIARQDIESIN